MAEATAEAVASTENMIPGNNIVVFYRIQATDINDGDRFGPGVEYGIAAVEENETPEEAAERYIKEESETRNCPNERAGQRHPMSYALKLLGFTNTPGQIIAPAGGDDVEVAEFFENHKEELGNLHKDGKCPYE